MMMMMMMIMIIIVIIIIIIIIIIFMTLLLLSLSWKFKATSFASESRKISCKVHLQRPPVAFLRDRSTHQGVQRPLLAFQEAKLQAEADHGEIQWGSELSRYGDVIGIQPGSWLRIRKLEVFGSLKFLFLNTGKYDSMGLNY